MKTYFGFILNITLAISGIFGFFNWIGNLTTALSMGNVFSFVIQLILAPLFIPLASIWPFIGLSIWIFPISAILYGIYWVTKKLIDG